MANPGPAIKMIRGNTRAWRISSKNAAGDPITFVTGDTVYMTLKKKALAEEAIVLQKIITAFPDGAAVIRIDPVDTQDLETGKYVYDIQVSFASGVVESTTATNNTQLIYWEVVEYAKVKSKQTGTFTCTGSLAAITVNRVNPAKCLLVLSHRSTLAGTTYTSFFVSGKVTSATSISILGVVTTTIAYWQLLEFE